MIFHVFPFKKNSVQVSASVFMAIKQIYEDSSIETRLIYTVKNIYNFFF